MSPQASLEAVRSWLCELAQDGEESSTQVHAQLLGTAWMAEGERACDADSVTRLLLERMPSIDVSEILPLDPILVGLAARATRDCGVGANPWMSALSEGADALDDRMHELPVFAAVLEAVTLRPACASGAPELPPTPLLVADADDWYRTATAVGAVSCFGRRKVQEVDVDALRLWLTAALRRYDLQVAAMLTTAILWLDRRAVAPVEHALEFFVRHQHEHGWFGHLGPELVGHPLAGDDRQLHRVVYLPIALNVCWALRQSIAGEPVF